MSAKTLITSAAKARLQASFATLAVSSALLAGATLLPSLVQEAYAATPLVQTGEYESNYEIPTPIAASSISSAADMGTLASQLDERAQEKRQQSQIDALLDTALSHVGAPYAYGGTTPRGFDCSGFVQYCMREAAGMELPRTAAAQSALGESVAMDSLEKGDLVYWGSGSGVYHVGIYIGDGRYIHAAGSGKGVRTDDFTYNAPSFAKRIL